MKFRVIADTALPDWLVPIEATNKGIVIWQDYGIDRSAG